MFVYQPTFNVLELNIGKGTKYIIGWRSKGLYNSKPMALYSSFLPNVEYFENKVGIQFNNTSLVIERISYTKKLFTSFMI